MNNRCQKVISLLQQVGADATIITSYENRRYLSGFTGSNATLFVHPMLQELYTDSRYTEQATKQANDFSVLQYDQSIGLAQRIMNAIKVTGVSRIAFEADKVTVSWYNDVKQYLTGIELIPVIEKFDALRNIKDNIEIECIKAAQKVTDDAFTHILSLLRPGITEIDVRNELEYYIAKRGGSTAFDTIVASGPNSSMPHAEPSCRVLQNGDFVTMDYGCKLNGYCSDMTRTVAIGTPTDEMKKIYMIVLEAQKRALDKIAPGVVCKDVDFAARGYITEKGYGDYFGHGLGHGFGLLIHEEPRFSIGCEDVIVPGICISVEPGIYLPDRFGVRIEDTVCTTTDGFINFTSSPKELIIL